MISAEELLGRNRPAAAVLAELCSYAVAKTGKQLRSQLVIEASRLGDYDQPNVHTAARAVELLHVATLAHDDVVDDSPLRRGQASLDSAYGSFAAGYVGAWLFGTSVELAAECGQQAVTLLASAACKLCDGEMLETQDLYNPARTEDRYLQAIAGKTASLFSLSAQLGGLTGGTSDLVYRELGHYGHLLGMAFQMADDILDFLSDRGGNKRRGDDLRHGVFTLPAIYAIDDDPSLREAITCEFDDETVSRFVAGARLTGAFRRAFAVCDRYTGAARDVARKLRAPWLEIFADRALAPLSEARET
jgi:heptaprenyl diphosphate synthase